MKDFNFLPVIEITPNTDFETQKHLDIWRDQADGVIDINKFYDYMTFAVLYRIKDPSLSNSEMVYTQNMRACVEADFLHHGISLTKDLKLKIFRRRLLCYDLSLSKGIEVQVQNF